MRLAKRGSRQQGREIIRARRGVISNASVWDTQRLLPSGAAPSKWQQESLTTPQTGSFMHLHLGTKHAALMPSVASGNHVEQFANWQGFVP